jgi:hypothetical protein
MPDNVKQQAADDVQRAVKEVGLQLEVGLRVIRRHVGWFEPKYAADREVTGKNRGRYQRAFHQALKRYVKQ